MSWLLRRNMLPLHSNSLARRPLASPPPLLPAPLPSPRETHLWYVVPDQLKDASLLNQYMDLLSPCERQSVLRMNGERLQKGALLARALVRTTLARYTDCRVSPKSFKFRKNRFGKPEVEWNKYDLWAPPPLQFNISHTSTMIACGVALDLPIGVDIEEKQRKTRNNILSLARRYFSPVEVAYLRTLADLESQRHEFIRLWTLKEAYVKALGRGFSGAPFKDFTIRLEASNSKQVTGESKSDASRIVVEAVDHPGILMNRWHFALFELNNSHYAAVCMERDVKDPDRENNSLKLEVWRTLPFVEDECVTETAAVKNIIR
ncbi:4'-phosphopantetheinyl transferase HetI isoform X2 [Phoenix dactylifera]|uniref:holo-[acyl-carrier-protein] synthase n=1 Tax=Phoenix dactylifera TaxID=42345 RepID=A0A8B7BNB8_PHODC|nr:4'-phosphopantetheinyl transferase HetI isoform X2 [Phoenix dactylifera]